MTLPELIYKVNDKLAYSQGKQKDIINLKEFIG